MTNTLDDLDDFGDFESSTEHWGDFDAHDVDDFDLMETDVGEDDLDLELGHDQIDEFGETMDHFDLEVDMEDETLDSFELEELGDLEIGDAFDEFDASDDFDVEGDDFDLEEPGWGELSGGEFGTEAADIEFLGKLIRGAGRLIKKGVRFLAKKIPLFKMLAPLAAKVLGTVVGGPAGAAIAGSLTKAVLGEAEASYESLEDVEERLESMEGVFVEGGGDPEVAALMEEAADEAADAMTAQEANAAIGRMMRLLMRLSRDPKIRRAMPLIARGLGALAVTLHRNPRTRFAVRLIPLIARRTLAVLSRQRRITKKSIVQALAQSTSWVLANRRRVKGATRHRRRFCRRVCVVRGRPVRRRPMRGRRVRFA